jgi:hypothetical protein
VIDVDDSDEDSDVQFEDQFPPSSSVVAHHDHNDYSLALKLQYSAGSPVNLNNDAAFARKIQAEEDADRQQRSAMSLEINDSTILGKSDAELAAHIQNEENNKSVAASLAIAKQLEQEESTGKSDAELAAQMQNEEMNRKRPYLPSSDEAASFAVAKQLEQKNERGEFPSSRHDHKDLVKNQVEETKSKTCGIASLINLYYSGQGGHQITSADRHARVWLSKSGVGPNHYHQVTNTNSREHKRTDGYSCGYKLQSILYVANLLARTRFFTA